MDKIIPVPKKRVKKSKKSMAKPRQGYVKFCPKCKSVDVNIEKSNPVQPSMGLPAMWVCNSCEHSGYDFPEVRASEVARFEKEAGREHLKKKGKDNTPLIDPAYGVFEVHIMWKLTAPIIILVSVWMVAKNLLLGWPVLILGILMAYITYFKKMRIKD